MNYIDLMLKQMMDGAEGRIPEVAQRQPAAQVAPATQTSLTPSIQMKVEPSTGSMFTPSGYKYQMPQSRLLEQNFEKSSGQREEYLNALSQKYSNATGEYEDAASAAKQLMQKQADLKPPERSDWADVISVVGPALTGALIGNESAYLAQEPAMKQSMGMVGQARQQEADRVAKVQAMLQERLTKQIDMAKLAKDEQKAYLKEAGDIKEKQAAAQEKGAKEFTDIELFPAKSEQRIKEAQILANTKPLTESQSKATFQLTQMEQAEKNLQDIRQKYGEYPSLNNKWFRIQKNIAGGMFGSTVMSDFLNSKAIDMPTRQQIQAELTFLESIGRIQSGAAINVGEWSQLREPFFATYGDTREVVAQKDQARAKALEGVRIMSGRGVEMIAPPKTVIKKEAPKQPTEITKEIGGRLYKKVEGGWRAVK